MTAKRYTHYCESSGEYSCGYEEKPDGEVVMFEDHERDLEQLTAAVLRLRKMNKALCNRAQKAEAVFFEAQGPADLGRLKNNTVFQILKTENLKLKDELAALQFKLDNANKDRAGLAAAIKVHRIAEEALQREVLMTSKERDSRVYECRVLGDTLDKTNRDLAAAREDLMLAPSERCKKYHIQCCGFCEKLDCGDNTSNVKEELAEARARIAEFEKDHIVGIATAAVPYIEDAGALRKELTEAKKTIDRMIRVYNAATSGEELVANQGQALDGFSELYNYRSIIKEAKERSDGQV